MDPNYVKERRHFLRYDYDKPLAFKTIKSPKELHADNSKGVVRNISASGLLFVSKVSEVPDISSILLLDIDFKTANICREIECQALISDNKLVGKVVRIEDNENGTCDVGVLFLTKSDPIAKDIKHF